MPRGPKGEKRPADAIGNAIMIAKIATGEIEDIATEDGKNAAAVALGRMGGKARAAGMTAKKRAEIAKKAAKSRWVPLAKLDFIIENDVWLEWFNHSRVIRAIVYRAGPPDIAAGHKSGLP
jgi:hypothetical protein